jgi:hypothetical protein
LKKGLSPEFVGIVHKHFWGFQKNKGRLLLAAFLVGKIKALDKILIRVYTGSKTHLKSTWKQKRGVCLQVLAPLLFYMKMKAEIYRLPLTKIEKIIILKI